MRIVSLVAENFKRLKAVRIDPTGDVVTLSGANAQGKSSILDAIWATLADSDMARATKTTRPVRDGEGKATVTLDLGQYVVTRKWTEDGKSSLVVASPDGARYTKPQGILDGLLGAISFDPMAFAMMKDADQRRQLMELVELPVDIDHLDRLRAGRYSDRTDVQRDIKVLEGKLADVGTVPESTPDEPINPMMILDRMTVANDLNNANAAKRQSLKESESLLAKLLADLTAGNKRIVDLKEQLAREQEMVATMMGRVAKGRETIAKMTAECEQLVEEDVSVFKAELESAQITNTLVDKKKKAAAIRAELAAMAAKAQKFTDDIRDIDAEKGNALSGAKLPVPGLGFSGEGVTYNGIPFAQCSSAERLRVSVAMAMACNPKLRVIRITDGSLIDSANMAVIREMCATNDFQVWVEKVDESGKVGIVIEDGEVVAVN